MPYILPTAFILFMFLFLPPPRHLAHSLPAVAYALFCSRTYWRVQLRPFSPTVHIPGSRDAMVTVLLFEPLHSTISFDFSRAACRSGCRTLPGYTCLPFCTVCSVLAYAWPLFTYSAAPLVTYAGALFYHRGFHCRYHYHCSTRDTPCSFTTFHLIISLHFTRSERLLRHSCRQLRSCSVTYTCYVGFTATAAFCSVRSYHCSVLVSLFVFISRCDFGLVSAYRTTPLTTRFRDITPDIPAVACRIDCVAPGLPTMNVALFIYLYHLFSSCCGTYVALDLVRPFGCSYVSAFLTRSRMVVRYSSLAPSLPATAYCAVRPRL